MNYYNEIDKYAAQWLRNLIDAGEIPVGDVDERDIRTMQPSDLRGYTQVHLFAGIGGWPYALKLAGWPDDRSVWTGSCPCQPFSVAGNHQAFADERHLWPFMFNCIKTAKPAIIFGEQVSSAIRYGWLDTVFDDLETKGYSCAAVVLPACSIGAPHIRERIYWVADLGLQRNKRQFQTTLSKQPTFSWCKNVRRVEDYRNRSDIPFPLVCSYSNGVSRGMEQVRAYGNAIVPQVAAAFIKAYMEC